MLVVAEEENQDLVQYLVQRKHLLHLVDLMELPVVTVVVEEVMEDQLQEQQQALLVLVQQILAEAEAAEVVNLMLPIIQVKLEEVE